MEYSVKGEENTDFQNDKSPAVIVTADLEMDTATRTVRRCGETINLSSKEYMIFEYLVLKKGTVLSRNEIEKHVWKFDSEDETNIINVYISNIRRKIDKGRSVKLIHTVRGKGYMFGIR